MLNELHSAVSGENFVTVNAIIVPRRRRQTTGNLGQQAEKRKDNVNAVNHSNYTNQLDEANKAACQCHKIPKGNQQFCMASPFLQDRFVCTCLIILALKANTTLKP